MIKRIITRIIIARLIPAAINAGQKAFRKKKPSIDSKAPKPDKADTPIN